MRSFIKSVLAVHVGVFSAGLLLNAAQDGLLGESVKDLATKINKGYGV